MSKEVPITELSNELSYNIDTASPSDIVRILQSCDQQIFEGWHGSDGVQNVSVINKVDTISKKIREIVDDPINGTVIITGCGTSGRLGFLTARTFNRYLTSVGKKPCFQYIIAGGDRALFTSQELEEDDPILGANELKKATQGKTNVVVIGVTCGLSAPFVAGQIEFCLHHLDTYTPVLIGFNPTHLARNVTIQNWDKTVLDVVKTLKEVEKSKKGFILNPIIGPEPITGSSRMKSGTTTRVLLETLALAAIENLSQSKIGDVFKIYGDVCNNVYTQIDNLSSTIEIAGNSLCSGGHIYYLGCDGFGLMGMIDASECLPTYGASLDDIRGFVLGGFSVFQNNEGDISASSPYCRISTDDFLKEILPNLSHNDLVVFIGQEIYHSMRSSFESFPCRIAFMLFDSLDKELPQSEKILKIHLVTHLLKDLPFGLTNRTFKLLLQEIASKWALNSISTGAHILKGKVLNNVMIDVRVSNNKLFHRALGIIMRYSEAPEDDCRLSLLKAIYATDCLTETHRSNSIEDHIKVATPAHKVVPTAILLAKLKCTVEQAKQLINEQPVVRKLLKEQQFENMKLKSIDLLN